MAAKSANDYLTLIARLLLGLVFFVFGLNGFLQFIPQPKERGLYTYSPLVILGEIFFCS
ncbi:MAG TPA: hypothetical protein VGI03_07855 [Verrucomicrobiae bacterium]|jgi:uncharacterized membrane protein YphA (DoxX/SURF4 family)